METNCRRKEEERVSDDGMRNCGRLKGIYRRNL